MSERRSIETPAGRFWVIEDSALPADKAFLVDERVFDQFYQQQPIPAELTPRRDDLVDALTYARMAPARYRPAILVPPRAERVHRGQRFPGGWQNYQAMRNHLGRSPAERQAWRESRRWRGLPERP